MSLLQLPFEIIEAVINELDADSLLVLLEAVPQRYPDIRCSILVSLLQRASDDGNRVKEYLLNCKPSVDLLKECLFCLKRRGQLYIIAEVFRTTIDRRDLVSKMRYCKGYCELSSIKGLREQDLMESVRDLIKQGHTEPAKRFLLADRKYETKTAELHQIYAIEHKSDNTSCTNESRKCCQILWDVLAVLRHAQRMAEQGHFNDCIMLLSHADYSARYGKLPEPDLRPIEKSMCQYDISFQVQRLKQLFQFVEQRDALLISPDLFTCRAQIEEAKRMAKEHGLSELELEKLNKRIETMESRSLQGRPPDMRAHQDGWVAAADKGVLQD